MTSTAKSPADHLVLEAVGAALGALSADARIGIALSGGVDSSVLLDAAVRVAGVSRCVALHVHHGLSPNADAWLAHCEAFARERGVEFAARRVDVSRDAGVSVEAAARDARYRALDALCAERGIHSLWLAQHADDQAETVLLQLLRGAGLAGLAAMAPELSPEGAAAKRVRPLLHVLRGQIEHYASARHLRWIDDESNADTRYARNALRHEVTPALTVHFPGFRDALARTAAHAAAAQRLLDALARIDLEAVSRDGGRALAHDALIALDDDRALNLLRYWMRQQGFIAASSARLGDALRQLREVSADGDGHRLRIDHAGHALRSYRGLVYWEAGDSRDPADESTFTEREIGELAWQGQAIWRLPQWRGTFIFQPVDASITDRANTADTANTPNPAADDAIPASLLRRAVLSARSRTGGERMRTSAAPGARSRTLKNLFQERGIPAWKRDVPLLFLGDELLFVPLLGVNRALLPRPVAPDEARVTIVWREDLLIA
ncbi:tRNA lysidine(34) synthetase TilS [Paraburkholderia phenoliruptrix]|uniref:tRNA(Ile)-lysidine synthase n=2 Tax=Paraburkholderia phenoliruptrix TaxID=252970 RepID=K0DN95_9BURK|nr:tRNA lysidine(34) synthetase TilS [Paraburkholderia phenoliruptrix]AFT86375.1 tRNA(Ile)-lysidine synthase [Paraburkholderia phenoliruptrix BR3459a]MDR6389020.1 tRNA(Ile)-lysidine synthase [Paraburkholderia phenoliruptrix]CAB4051284.1 tRNA(Ile)-lysidine synthase [Paraburkholderia phenoliruptrix]